MKSLVCIGTLCLSFLSWNCSAQNISLAIESQQQSVEHNIQPTLFVPLGNAKYQIMSFISIKADHKFHQSPQYKKQGYGLGMSFQATPWLTSQLVVQENGSRNSHESKFNIEVDF